MRKPTLTLLALLIAVFAHSFCSAAAVRRYAIVSGANRGGPSRPTLRYAVSDAEAFARLIEQLGGVKREDCKVLREPSLIDFGKALEALRADIKQSRAASERVEVLFYYSGHADDQGLLLAGTRFPYQKIREEMALLKADVNVAVLDACASGAITRQKGVIRQPAFLANSSADMKGYAFLTSSSENETAQESDRIRASFFTYYLISALRGAADSNADGKVSLNEAYDFSYNETLGRTAKTQGGPQHPAYDIQMSGTGELVLTDVRGVSSILVIPETLSGRVYILNTDRQLVTELFKTEGRKIALGMQSGNYSIYVDSGNDFLAASIKLAEKQTLVLDSGLFTSTKKEPSILRGPSIYQGDKPAGPAVKKFEIGGHYSSFSHFLAGIGRPGNFGERGGGARFAYNLNNHLAFEAQTNYWPGNYEQRFLTLFGAKAGVRRSGWGVFGVVRPGFLIERKHFRCVLACDTPGLLPLTVNANRFALDFGGVLELSDFGVYRSDRLFFRLDVTDTVVSQPIGMWRYSASEPPFFQGQFETQHTPRISVGAGFRF
ncbi:MAG: caspase family protein [Acidobacteria bacterium]|nr:MAG: caspase family protein [Acidobacteriota bacterium]